jgi:CubicO group peptidase (beta-lactamase class C family)
MSMVVARTLRTVLNADAVNALNNRIQAEIDDGHSNSAQFALGLHGEIVAGGSFGAAKPDSRFVIFSATKVITAMSLLPHLADGSVELTAPVAGYVPGFADNGKGGVTVLQLLTMQGGFRKPSSARIAGRPATVGGSSSPSGHWPGRPAPAPSTTRSPPTG